MWIKNYIRRSICIIIILQFVFWINLIKK